jgi:hypothetical protein
MFRNRITTMLEPEPIRLPQPPMPPMNSCAFVLVALPAASIQQWTMQQWIYQQAFAAAQAVCRPSILERELFGMWN